MSMSESASGKADSGNDSYDKEASAPHAQYPRLADREWYYQKYVVEGNSTTDIAELVGCAKTTARKWKQKHDIDSIGAYKSRGTEADNPCSNGGYVDCYICGEEVYKPQSRIERHDNIFCSRDCLSEWLSNQTGEDHPLYEGGPQHYGKEWKATRERIRERDNHECQVCNRPESDVDYRLEVHHIMPVRKFDDPTDAHTDDNLITLCRTCHTDWEGIPLRPQS